MKITVSRESFLKALQKVTNIIGSRSTLPILANILLEAEGNELTLTTTDLEVRVTTKIEVMIETEGKTTIPAKKLLALVSKLRDDNVILDCNEKHHTKIDCGTASFMLLGLAADDFPLPIEFTPIRTLTFEASDLARIFDQISYAVSLDDSRKVLHGILCTVKENTFTAVATDGKRLALVEKILEGYTGSEGDCIIPLKSATELKRLIVGEKEVSVNIGEKQISFETTKAQLSSKLIEGNYPNYRQVIPPSFSRSINIDSAQFQTKLELVSLALADSSAFVKLSFDKNQLTFDASSTNIGEGTDVLPIEYDDGELNISFNPAFLSAPFRHSGADSVVMKMNDGFSPVAVEGGDGFLYVIMPMRNK